MRKSIQKNILITHYFKTLLALVMEALESLMRQFYTIKKQLRLSLIMLKRIIILLALFKPDDAREAPAFLVDDPAVTPFLPVETPATPPFFEESGERNLSVAEASRLPAF